MDSKKKQTILYVYPNLSSFVKNDIAFLKDTYNVKTQDLPWGNAVLLPLNLLRQFIFLLVNLKQAKLILVSFGGYFSWLPTMIGKWFGVSTMIILNGTDCVSFPEYNSGSLRKKLLRFFIKKSYKNASKLLPVDVSLVKQIHVFDPKISIKNQGYQSFFPDINTAYSVIPNGFDIEFWNFTATIKKSGFITVAMVNSLKTLKFKGIDLFIDLAREFPKQQFTVVGVSEVVQNQLKELPKNIKFYSFLTKDVLKQEVVKHQFYVQLSINEGFGCALAEAMLCGCIPIVANTGALPNVINGTGHVVAERSLNNAHQILKQALENNSEENILLSKRARKRIVTNFSISNREELLLQEIENRS